MPKLWFRVLANVTKHTHGSGPSACNIWHMLNGLVGELTLRCRETIIRNMLLLMTRRPVCPMVRLQRSPLAWKCSLGRVIALLRTPMWDLLGVGAVVLCRTRLS